MNFAPNQKQIEGIIHFLAIVILAYLSVDSIAPIESVKDCSIIPEVKTCNDFTQRQFGRVDYERLKLGMTVAEVESILGSGVEISQSSDSSIFVWMNLDGSSMKVEFVGGKLTQKKLEGLI